MPRIYRETKPIKITLPFGPSSLASSGVTLTKNDKKISKKGVDGMKIIYWPRQYGKTTELAKLAQDNNGILIARDDSSKKYVQQKFPDIEVYTIKELVDGDLRGKTKPLYIDDAEEVLNLLVRDYTLSKVDGISLTMERPY